MAKTFMPELSQQERLRIMQETADHIEEGEYFKSLSQEELDASREQFLDNDEKIFNLEEELAATREKVKGEIKPLKTKNAILRTEIKTRKRKVDGKLFMFSDPEAGMMDSYDEMGELVSSRRLAPEERQQARLFIAGKVSNG